MKISIMQPTYLPWLGYFDLMDRSDIFVFYDDVQFVGRSWHHKNKIKQKNGELLITVPVFQKGELDQTINQARINNVGNWAKKHLRNIEHGYSKARYYREYIEELRSIYHNNYEKVIDLNLTIIEFLKEKLKINTVTALSSSLGIPKGEKREERVVNICKYYDADIIFEGVGGKSFADLTPFAEAGLEVVFHDYKHPVYNQLHGDFIPYLSVLDLLLNEGSERSLEIIRSGRV